MTGEHLIPSWVVVLSLIKGVLIAATLFTILNPSFIQAISVAATSAIITGVFLIIATHMQTKRMERETMRNRDKIEEVATKLEGTNDGG